MLLALLPRPQQREEGKQKHHHERDSDADENDGRDEIRVVDDDDHDKKRVADDSKHTPPNSVDLCFICGFSMLSLSDRQRQEHVNNCLDHSPSAVSALNHSHSSSSASSAQSAYSGSSCYLAASSSSAAASSSSSRMVFVSSSSRSTHYHLIEHYNAHLPITEEQAIREGRKPCAVCLPNHHS